MPTYNCPLCKQIVSLQIYEKITGVWEEKQKRLKELAKKESELKKKAKQEKLRYETELKNINSNHSKELTNKLKFQNEKNEKKYIKLQERLNKEKEILEKQYQKKISTEVNRFKKLEKERIKKQEHDKSERLMKKKNIEIDKIHKKLNKEKSKLENEKKIEKDKRDKVLKQFYSFQKKSNAKIKSLEEQLSKNKTAQVLGFENEKEFLKELKSNFPNDEFQHTGKQGDIVHIINDGGKKAGVIVYELKKVAKFNNNFITQTLNAQKDRNADYGILVTNTMPVSIKQGFGIVKKVIIVHHAGAIILIKLLRQNLIDISRANLNKEERSKTVKLVFNYIQGPGFKNSISTVIQNSIDLYDDLIKEIKNHTKQWQFRYDKYKDIYSNANKIEANILAPMLTDEEKKKLPKQKKITPIQLPENIK